MAAMEQQTYQEVQDVEQEEEEQPLYGPTPLEALEVGSRPDR